MVSHFCARKEQMNTAKIYENGTIKKTKEQSETSPTFDSNFATEGFVDLQVNGFAGVDFNKPGVTRLLK